MSGLQGDRHSFIASFADRLNQRNLTQKRDIQFLGEVLSAIFAEDIVFIFRQFGRGEPSHVLDKTKDRHVHFLVAEHLHTFACIHECYGLRRSDHDDTRELEFRDMRQVNIARSGRQVNQEIIEFTPMGIFDELFDGV